MKIKSRTTKNAKSATANRCLINEIRVMNILRVKSDRLLCDPSRFACESSYGLKLDWQILAVQSSPANDSPSNDPHKLSSAQRSSNGQLSSHRKPTKRQRAAGRVFAAVHETAQIEQSTL